jgi:pimeloyl-ACP methyl ester carboxylesterase
MAPGWPGESSTVEETRNQSERVAGYGINDVVEHYARIVSALDAKPIVIGHSFGGLVVQRLLGQDLAAAVVAIDAAPIKGVFYLPLSALRVASVALRNPAKKKRAVALTAKQFRYGFGNAVSAPRIRRAVRTVDHPLAGEALVRGRIRQSLYPVTSQGQDRQRDPRASPANRRGHGPYCPGRHHQVDPQAVPQVTRGDGLHGVP